MDKDRVFKMLRKLAKMPEYQNIYSSEKLNLCLFKNNMSLTEVQYNFLGYLSFYSSLYMDLALGEIDEKIFADEIYEDAYAYYKRHKKEEQPKINTPKKEETPIGSSKWIFRRGKK